jgi:hypothetical protein
MIKTKIIIGLIGVLIACIAHAIALGIEPSPILGLITFIIVIIIIDWNSGGFDFKNKKD